MQGKNTKHQEFVKSNSDSPTYSYMFPCDTHFNTDVSDLHQFFYKNITKILNCFVELQKFTQPQKNCKEILPFAVLYMLL